MQETEKTKPAFGTFHAIFFHILKNTYGMDVTNILTEPQKYQVMREIIAQQKLDYKDEKEIIDHLLSEISTVKNERIPLEYFYSSHCGEDIFRTIYS